MQRNWPATETEVAAPVVAWFVEAGYEVFQEVEHGDNVADIVARKDGCIWVVETKKTLSLDVLAQARAWKHWSTKVSVAVPARNRLRKGWRVESRGHQLATDVCRWLGLGLFEVRDPSTKYMEIVLPVLTPEVNEKAYTERWKLVEAQKTFCEAGSQAGRWTPFKQTCENLRVFVEAHPGCTVAEAVEGIEQHYRAKATARSRLRLMVEGGVVGGVRLTREDGTVRLFPVEGVNDGNSE